MRGSIHGGMIPRERFSIYHTAPLPPESKRTFTDQFQGDYETASPCSPIDLPQTLLEPILVRHAIKTGFSVRFNTSLISFAVENPPNGPITATVHDNLTNIDYKIHTDYLFGADGARSQVVKQLDLPDQKARPGTRNQRARQSRSEPFGTVPHGESALGHAARQGPSGLRMDGYSAHGQAVDGVDVYLFPGSEVQ